MPVMQIGIMRVRMAQRRVPMGVRMRLRHRPIVCVPVVFIVHMAVFVFERLVLMFMGVALGEMHP